MQDVSAIVAGIQEVSRAGAAAVDLVAERLGELPDERDDELDEFAFLLESVVDRLAVLADLMGMSEGQLQWFAGDEDAPDRSQYQPPAGRRRTPVSAPT